MLESKRKNKKTRKKAIIRIIILTLVIVLSISTGLYLYLLKSRRPLYISPLAPNFSFTHQTAEDRNVGVLKIGLRSMHIDYDNIAHVDSGYLIKLKDKSQILLSDTRDMRSQLASLQFILSRLTMEGKLFTQLDLRFDKPVIRVK